MDNRPIGIFDSGFGGLTSAEILRAGLPSEEIIYFGDSGRMPYGDKSREQLMVFGRQNVDFLLSFDVKLILAACGTLSTVALPSLRESSPVPIFGVVDAGARAAAEATAGDRVAVIATEATIRGGAFQRALGLLLPESEVLAVACPKFVPLIEAGRVRPDDEGVMEAIREHLTSLRERGIDTLLLGCTHYPLMGEAIGAFMGAGVKLVGAGEAAAAELMERLRSDGLSASPDRRGRQTYYTSGDAGQFAWTAKLILGGKLDGEIYHVPPMEY